MDEILYIIILALTKISIITFYLRIFPQRSFHHASFWILGTIALSNTVLAFLAIFQCWPINLAWEGWKIYKDHPNCEKCLNAHLIAYIAAGFSIFYDAVLIALPLPLIWGLNASNRAKLGVGLMLSLGVFVLITSCIRLRYLVNFARHRNVTWYYTDPLIWSGVEVAVSVTITSLPAVRVLVQKLWPGLVGTFPTISMSRRTGEKIRTDGPRASTGMREKVGSSLVTCSTGQGQTPPDSRAGLFASSESDRQYDTMLGENKGLGETHCEIRSNGCSAEWPTPGPEHPGIRIDTKTSVEDSAGCGKRGDNTDMV